MVDFSSMYPNFDKIFPNIEEEDKMYKFKNGDKFRVTDGNMFFGIKADDIGIITNDTDQFSLETKIGPMDRYWIMHSQIELVEEAPKTYNIEEVIAELRENPTKKFREKYNNGDGYITLNENTNNIVWLGGNNKGQVVGLGGVDDIWIEVLNKPMSFQEVCQVVLDADDYIEIRYEDEEVKIEGPLEKIITKLEDVYFNNQLADIFINGKFYII